VKHQPQRVGLTHELMDEVCCIDVMMYVAITNFTYLGCHNTYQAIGFSFSSLLVYGPFLFVISASIFGERK